jgi:hypothetical protein
MNRKPKTLGVWLGCGSAQKSFQVGMLLSSP